MPKAKQKTVFKNPTIPSYVGFFVLLVITALFAIIYLDSLNRTPANAPVQVLPLEKGIHSTLPKK